MWAVGSPVARSQRTSVRIATRTSTSSCVTILLVMYRLAAYRLVGGVPGAVDAAATYASRAVRGGTAGADTGDQVPAIT